MSLVRCHNCRQLYNSREKVCPKCGEPFRLPFKRLWTVLGALVLLGWAVAAIFFKD